MDILYPCCCGLDIHKKTVAACLLFLDTKGRPRREVRTFGTMTDELLALADWLTAAGCTHLAMESTGVYWKPIYNLLEDSFTLLLVNAHHIKAVPGRKTDARDCEWIADLLQHGLLRGSFIPPRDHRELRELVRYRTALVRERGDEANRLQKTLEGANIKLASVATDILGNSGRAMLAALIDGTTDPATLANLAQGRLRAKRDDLARALHGRIAPHQRFLLVEQLRHIDTLEEAITRVSAEITNRMAPFAAEIEALDMIPGISQRTAEILIAEIGTDMTQFPSAQHLASWAGMCPGSNESAGKRRSGKTRKGSPWLRAILIEAARAAARTKESYLSAHYHRIAARRGAKRAAVAVGHSILVIVYHLLKRGTTYTDLGVDYFVRRDRQAVEHRLVRRLEGLGYRVSLAPRAP